MKTLTREQLDSVAYNDVLLLREIKALYAQITDQLSLSQYKHLMSGDMSYTSKAERAKRVSKSKRVHAAANRIIELMIQLKAVQGE